MQFTKPFKEQIRAGTVTVSFRNWRRPQAKVGGVYKLHPDGAIRVTQIDMVEAGRINTADARAAGFDDPDAIRSFLDVAPTQPLYRVEFVAVGDAAIPPKPVFDVATAVTKLDRTDARSERPWTTIVLRLIRDNPEVRAGNLAPELGWQTPRFKANVRKLKGLGLTTSFETGYALTDLGRAVLAERTADP